MSSISEINLNSRPPKYFFLAQVSTWCGKQWINLGAPVNNASPLKDVLKKIILLVPLMVVSAAAPFIDLGRYVHYRLKNRVVDEHANIQGKINYDLDLHSQINSVVLENSGDLIIQEGDTNSLTVTADHKVLKHLKIRHITIPQSDDVRLVLYSSGIFRTSHPISYTLTLKHSLKNLTTVGSGLAIVTNVDTTSFSCDLKGSGSVLVQNGVMNTQTVNLTGSGKYEALDAFAVHSIATINGSGNVYIRASDSLSATVRGSGSCFYRSPVPQSFATDISGTGKVARYIEPDLD